MYFSFFFEEETNAIDILDNFDIVAKIWHLQLLAQSIKLVTRKQTKDMLIIPKMTKDSLNKT